MNKYEITYLKSAVTMGKNYQTTFNFVKHTKRFCLLAFVLCGFTTIMLLAIQMLFNWFLQDCIKSMQLTWCLCLISCVVVPVIFRFYLKNKEVHNNRHLKTGLNIFNILILISIQGVLGIFSDPEILCYGKDGQNGIEFGFYGWVALPILILVSYYFKSLKISAIFYEAG